MSCWCSRRKRAWAIFAPVAALSAEVTAEVELLLAECDESGGPQPLVEGMAALCVQAYQQARIIDHFPPGMRLLDQYDLLESIGEGGQSVVYKAHDTRLDRHVAVKDLPGSSLS